MSKTPYIMGIPEFKELQMQLEELLKRGIYCQVCHLGELWFYL
jgi:hypothetical protein